jgi:hypothetical protein
VRAACDGGSLGAWEGVLGGGEDMGRCLTYIGESLGFVLGFRVGPWINRLVGLMGRGIESATGLKNGLWQGNQLGHGNGLSPRAKGSFKSFLIF